MLQEDRKLYTFEAQRNLNWLGNTTIEYNYLRIFESNKNNESRISKFSFISHLYVAKEAENKIIRVFEISFGSVMGIFTIYCLLFWLAIFLCVLGPFLAWMRHKCYSHQQIPRHITMNPMYNSSEDRQNALRVHSDPI